MNELFYLDESGNNVHTTQFLKNRGSCCKTNCLHCPYGTTLKNCGLEFEKAKQEDIFKVQEIINSNTKEKGGLAEDLLSSAFGAKKEDKVTKFNYDQYYFILLKDIVCGVAHKGRLQLKKVFLKEHFKDQGLDLETVSSFFRE